ncbi:MAG: amidohydrolase family protein [Thermodesulfobacteriota bacterium]
MKTIALEEHIGTPDIVAAARATGRMLSRKTPVGVVEKLGNMAAGRLADMDAAGIDMQVLSATGIGLDTLDRRTGTVLARESNDRLAEVVGSRPDRFAAFALLAMQDPEGAAAELERCVASLGFKGALISGTIHDRFLDDPAFEPVLAQAERMDVPLYLHPAPPPASVYKAYFSGLPDEIAGSLATSAWGWHAETGLHSLRLVVAGVFDRFPKLQVIVGHMGENLPFSLARADERLAPFTTHLRRRVKDYFLAHFHLTTSAYFTLPPLLCALMVFGIDRILFSVDYPFSANAPGRTLLETAPLSPADLEKIAHLNAERLLKL